MFNISLNLDSKTEYKLQKILSQYKDKELFAQNIIEYEISQLKRAIVNIDIDLKHFEKKYGLSTVEFYNKFEKGKMQDTQDFIIWSGIYEMLQQNKKRLEELQ